MSDNFVLQEMPYYESYRRLGDPCSFCTKKYGADKFNCQTLPIAVVESIFNAWEDQAKEILKGLKYDHLCGNWYFTRWGMYVGVEEDGYIHT